MVNAREIVTLMLEGGPQSPGGLSGVWAFGPGLPAEGGVYTSLSDLLATFQRNGFIRPNQGRPEDTLDELIGTGYTIIQKKDPRDTVVYSRKLPVRMTPDVAERVKRYLGIEDETRIVHKQHTGDGRGQVTTGQYVLYGSKELEKEKQATKDQSAAARKKRLIPYNDFGGHPQEPFDPEAEDFHPVPEVKVGKVTQQPHPRGSLGFTFDGSYEAMAMNEQEKGCMVAAVHDGGPMAQAGVQAGDLIQTATYVGDDGKQNEWRIRGQQNMATALASADPSYPMILHVRRGSQQLNVVVELKTAQPSSDTLHIPAAEAQRYGKEQDAKEQSARQRLSAPESRQRPTTPRQMPLRGLPRGSRPQKTFKFTPNEPPPTSQTGNLPPNVSTLT